MNDNQTTHDVEIEPKEESPKVESLNEEVLSSDDNTQQATTEIKEKKKKSFVKPLLIGVGLLLVMTLVGLFYIDHSAYDPQDIAQQSVVSDDAVTVVVNGNITFTPKNVEPTKGYIFYPGAMVEPMAYAPYARMIAEQGYEVVIVKMPLNFAVLSANKAQEVIDSYENIKTWAIGGHSLGGVMAAKFASENDRIDGVVLLASYPQGDELKNLDKDVLSIWGDLDGVLNFDSLEQSKANLPADTTFIEIEGGNHAQFGDYGFQKGDQEATISPQEQLDISVQATLELLEK